MQIVKDFLSSQSDSPISLYDFVDGVMSTFDKPYFTIAKHYGSNGEHVSSNCTFAEGALTLLQYHHNNKIYFILASEKDEHMKRLLLLNPNIDMDLFDESVALFELENIDELIANTQLKQDCLKFIFANFQSLAYNLVLERSGEAGHYHADDEALVKQFDEFLLDVKNVYLPHMQKVDNVI